METLEAQLVGLWPILRHEKETKLIKCFRIQTHFHNCERMQRSKSQHPKCHKYKNYKDKEFLKYTKINANYATNILKSKYKDVQKLKKHDHEVCKIKFQIKFYSNNIKKMNT
jgi:hypothetical protein